MKREPGYDYTESAVVARFEWRLRPHRGRESMLMHELMRDWHRGMLLGLVEMIEEGVSRRLLRRARWPAGRPGRVGEAESVGSGGRSVELTQSPVLGCQGAHCRSAFRETGRAADAETP